MYKKIARSITDKFVKNGRIQQEKANVYAYGFEIILSTLVYTLIFIVTAIITNALFESLLFWLGFFIVRTIAGGYHARTYISCHILFFLTHCSFIAFIKLLPDAIRLTSFLIIMCISIFSMIVFAPVDHPNKPFTEHQQKKFRKLSLIFAAIEVLLSILVVISIFIWDFNLYYLLCPSYGVFIATLSLVSAKIIKKEKGENQ